MIGLFGFLTILFVVLSGMTGMKKYTKNKVVVFLGSKHRIFGVLAVVSSLVHFVLNMIGGNTNVLGFLILVLLVAAVIGGNLVKPLKSKLILTVHKMVGPLVLLLAVIHIFTN